MLSGLSDECHWCCCKWKLICIWHNYVYKGVLDSTVVSALDCRPKRSWVQFPARAEIWFEISVPQAPPSRLSYDEYTDQHGRWIIETVRERTGHPPSFAVAMKMESLTRHPRWLPKG